MTASYWDETLRVWNAVNGQPVARLEGLTGRIIQAASLPDNPLDLSFIDARQYRIVLITRPGPATIVAIRDTRAGLVVGIEDEKRFFTTAPRTAAVIPIHNAAAAAHDPRWYRAVQASASSEEALC